MTTETSPKRLDGGAKMAVELGPLAFFMLGYFLHSRLGPVVDGLLGTTFFAEEGNELFLGLALFMPALAVALLYSFVKVGRVAPMLWVSSVIVVVLGAITFILQDKTFFYMKPTIVYGLTAAVLGGGLLVGRNFLKSLFDGALELDDAAWRTLTWRFVAFNLAAAIANEVLWRSLTGDCVAGESCAGEATWVNIKVFGFTAAYFVFIIANTPFLMKHMKQEAAERAASDVDGVTAAFAENKPETGENRPSNPVDRV